MSRKVLAQFLPSYSLCARTRYRIRRCCGYCNQWQIWRNELIVQGGFSSGQEAIRFYDRSARLKSLQNAKV